MTITLEEHVRRIVRAELRANGLLLEQCPKGALLADAGPDAAQEAVDAFLATLAPGERVYGAALYERWRAWARESAYGFDGITRTRFGRVAVRSPWVARLKASRSLYVRLPAPVDA